MTTEKGVRSDCMIAGANDEGLRGTRRQSYPHESIPYPRFESTETFRPRCL